MQWVFLNEKVSCIFQVDHDHCSPNPCDNDAPCFNTQADYYCHCPEDWEGKNCSMPRLQCSSPPCEGIVHWYFTFRKSTLFECLINTEVLDKPWHESQMYLEIKYHLFLKIFLFQFTYYWYRSTGFITLFHQCLIHGS